MGTFTPASVACYTDTLFASEIYENLRNHRIQPRFFYRCDGWLWKTLRMESVQIGRLVFLAKKRSYPCKQ
jgi:hypothetical protein